MNREQRRPYTLRRRAEAQAETRRRIVAAALELHRTLGPARTSLSAVAERAGVQRHTLYRHFPDEVALFRACGEHFFATSRPPDLEAWQAAADSALHLRTALADLYDWYGRNQDAIGRALRDSEIVPVGGAVRRLQEAALALLDQGDAGRRAAVRMAVDFGAWRALSNGGALSPGEAARLAAGMVEAASLRTAAETDQAGLRSSG